MKYAIIAAGEGSRLAQEGVKEPKPLVMVGGERLIDRLLRIFMDNGAEEIAVICNDMTTLVSKHLEEIRQQGLGGRQVPLRYIVKSTPSSLHSFYELTSLLGNGKFVLTTVDTIFREDEFADDMTISGFYDEPHDCRYISAGIYGLRSSAKDIARQQIEQGTSRMRNFQRALVAAGLAIKAHPFSKVLDIDHREDIEKAEELLNQQSR